MVPRVHPTLGLATPRAPKPTAPSHSPSRARLSLKPFPDPQVPRASDHAQDGPLQPKPRAAGAPGRSARPAAPRRGGWSFAWGAWLCRGVRGLAGQEEVLETPGHSFAGHGVLVSMTRAVAILGDQTPKEQKQGCGQSSSGGRAGGCPPLAWDSRHCHVLSPPTPASGRDLEAAPPVATGAVPSAEAGAGRSGLQHVRRGAPPPALCQGRGSERAQGGTKTRETGQSGN